MSAYDFVNQQLRDYFADASRLRAELETVRDRLVRAEMKIHALEVALAERDSESVTTPDSCAMKSVDTAILKKAAH